MSTLLLVDSTVEGYSQIVAAARSDVHVVEFNSYTDTYSSLENKIRNSGVSQFNIIGFVQHGSSISSEYRLLRNEPANPLYNIKETDPELLQWVSYIEFIQRLKETYGTTTVDLISCQLYANPDMVYVISELEKKTGINFRASTNNTGNLKSGGDWIQESDGVDIRDLYFTDAIEAYTDLLFGSYGIQFRQITEATTRANAKARMVSATNKVLDMVNISNNTNGIQTNIYCWGELYSIVPSTTFPLSVSIKSFAYKNNAVSIIDNLNNVIAVGDPGGGGIAPSSLSTGDIIQIASNQYALIALKSTGEVIQWGVSPIYGFTATPPEGLSNVVAIALAERAVAALKSDGTVVAWGQSSDGGEVPAGLTDVASISSSLYAFAALRNDGTVVSWGYIPSVGGSDFSSLTNVNAIIASSNSFTALKADGTVACWGTSTPTGLTNVVSVTSVYYNAFAALKDDQSVVAWGYESYMNHPVGLTNVVSITSNKYGFAALKADGTVVSWGHTSYNFTAPATLSGVIAICSTIEAFAALKSNGSVVAWGNQLYGGVAPVNLSNVVSITSNGYAFAVLKNDGTFQCWGDSSYGGASPTYGPSKYAAILPVGYGEFIGLTSYKEVPITLHPISYNVPPNSNYTMYVRGYNSYFNSKPITYKWYKNGIEIPGATSNSYTISNMSSSDVGSYTARVISSKFVSTQITSDMSDPAVITMYVDPASLPSIISQPSSLTVLDGSAALFSVVATGTAPLSYQWYKDDIAIADVSSSIFIINSASTSDAGIYKVIVSNTSGSATSNEATLTVEPRIVIGTAPVITDQPASLTVLDGSAASFSVVATGTAPLSYQWYKDGASISGATSDIFSIPSVSSISSGNYYVDISNSYGSVSSSIISLIRVSPLSFTRSLELSQNAIVDARVFFRVDVAGSGPVSYAWSKDGILIADVSSSTYTLNNVSTSDAGAYTVIASSPYMSITSSGSLTVTTATTIDQTTFVSGNIPNDTTVQYSGRTINNASTTYSGASKTVAGGSSAFVANPTAATASQRSVSLQNVPPSVERAVIAISPVITQVGRPPSVNMQIKLFDTENNYISDVSNSPVTVRIKMPSTFTNATLNVYRVLNVDTNTLELAGTATKLATTVAPATTYELTLPRFSDFIITEEDLLANTPIPCFPAGTRVLTTDGYKPVERLNKADRLITSDGRAVEFKRYYSVIAKTTKETAPYRIPAHTFGPQQPAADIVLSPLHAFQSRKGVWQIPMVAARRLPEIQQINIGSPIVYFHLQTPNYLRDNIVLEGGVVAESFGGSAYAKQTDIYTYSATLQGFTRRAPSLPISMK